MPRPLAPAGASAVRPSRNAAAALALAALLGAAARSDALPDPADPVARGLDVFVHVPGQAAPRAILPVQIEAFGFPTVVSLVPLSGATVEAAWDPDSLGPGVSVVPPAIRGTTDASGRAHLDVPVPDGDVKTLSLLVGVRSGGHSRTREITVHRGRLHDVAVHLTDTRVVPGSSVSAWVVVTSAATGTPVPSAPVELSLLEGGLAWSKVTVTTDAAGTGMARVSIPRTEEPAWGWKLRARTFAGEGMSGLTAGTDETELSLREETPGRPTLAAAWTKSSVLAGDKVGYALSVRDAAGQPVAGLAVRTWIGPRGTHQPATAEEWEKVPLRAVTDAAGEVTGTADAPSTVVKEGTSLSLVARTSVEGHDLEQNAGLVAIGYPMSTVELLPEATSILPGVEQRMLLRVRDGWRRPVAATFSVQGDGLDAKVTTDAFGEAEVAWHPPAEVGALRNVGPCAGGVAAAVVVRPVGEVPALAPRTEPFQICVPVDREAAAVLEVDKPVARIGDRVHVRLHAAAARTPEPSSPRGLGPLAAPSSARGKGGHGASEERGGHAAPAAPYSVVLRSANGEQAASVWIEDGEQGGDLEIPAGASGVWSLSAASPSPVRAARVAAGSMLVLPRALPALAARVGAGRAAPGGSVEVDVDLGDGHGKGLPGTVAAVVLDLHGGGSAGGFHAFDTRHRLCGLLGVEAERCDRFLEGDGTEDPLRRGLLGRGEAPLAPVLDPGGTASVQLTQAFGEVLRSLEGAVFEATKTPDQLLDVRRALKGPGAFAFNPELMTLVTAAMSPAPETPGGEPLALGDLLAVDPQVTFNNVARRVTRLKVFRVLAAVRSFRRSHQLDPDEPMMKAPNAILRRLVRDGALSEDALLDPWGGTLQFTKASGPPIPFLTAVRGFELRAPGPDGKLGTADDVRDPFERVLRSGTPYAKAVDEDRLVDSQFDLEVSDETVSAWERLFEELTGTTLGGLGLNGVGEGGGGTGQGFGSGHGRLGGSAHGRGTLAIATGDAFWTAPQRTDANGHVRIHVPLGDLETTWQVALVGVPDGGTPATTTLDVPVALPLSARVEAGAKWVEGDEVGVSIAVRNRTAKALRATLAVAAGGVAALADARDASRVVDVPAGGASEVTVRVRAARAGLGTLEVTTQSPGVPDDVVRHAWDVLPPGEPTNLTASQWVEGTPEAKPGSAEEATVAPSTELVAAVDASVRLAGQPRLVLQRGAEEPLAAALDALDPDRLSSLDSLADAVEVGARLERWAIARSGEASPLAARAGEVRRRATGRLVELSAHRKEGLWAALARAHAWAREKELASPPSAPGACPPADATSFEDRLRGLDAEPVPASGAVLACWDAFVGSAVDALQKSGDPAALARAVLALAERPHRSALLESLTDKLREQVALRASGGITLPPAVARSRAARATVFAALLRTARLGKAGPATADRLAAWIGVQRDVEGGYGSSVATRSVVRALLSMSDAEPAGTSRVTVIAETPGSDGGPGAVAGRSEVEVGPSARVVVPLPAGVTRVKLSALGPGVVARFERPVVRLWSRPPDEEASPLHLDATWPDGAAGKTGLLRLSVRHDLGRAVEVDLRVPLPPGVSLAEGVNGVRQIQGALAIRRSLDASSLPATIELPLRFGLPGKMTVPEAWATAAGEELPRAVAPARPLRVE